MSNIKKVLYNGSILKLGNTNDENNKIPSNFDYGIEKHKWKSGSNAVFHYKTWMISFSPNSLTSDTPIPIPIDYNDSRCIRCNHCNLSEKIKYNRPLNKNEKRGWRKKGNKYSFDDDVLDYFKNHYTKINEHENENENENENELKHENEHECKCECHCETITEEDHTITTENNNHTNSNKKRNNKKNNKKNNNRNNSNNSNNNNSNNNKTDHYKFKVTPVGDTHSINNEKPFELRLGRKFSASAFEDCIQTMKEGEKSLFLCVPDTIIGYNKMEIILRHIDYKTHLLENDAEINTKDDTDLAQHLISYKNQLYEKYHALTQSNIVLLLEIELLNIQLPETFKKSIWEMNNEEKYKHATTLKDEGNQLFKSSEYNQASVKFQEALSILQIMIHSGSLLNEKFSRQCTVKDTNENKEIKSSKKKNENNEKDFNSLDKLMSLCNICRLNYSACQLKLKNYQTVITNCTEVLKNDPENVKAYFRRGKAYSMLDSDLELAKKDFYKLKEIYVKHIEEEEEEGKLNTVLLPSSDTNNKLHFNFKDEINNLNTEIKLLETKIKQKNSQQKSFFARLFSS